MYLVAAFFSFFFRVFVLSCFRDSILCAELMCRRNIVNHGPQIDDFGVHDQAVSVLFFAARFAHQ
jgi:hypothetical protein